MPALWARTADGSAATALAADRTRVRKARRLMADEGQFLITAFDFDSRTPSMSISQMLAGMCKEGEQRSGTGDGLPRNWRHPSRHPSANGASCSWICAGNNKRMAQLRRISIDAVAMSSCVKRCDVRKRSCVETFREL
jgi:hypothetical protein